LIYFYLTNDEAKEFNLKPLLDKIYMYGAYNQITVCQMRSLGEIREMTNEEKNKFKASIEKRLEGKDIGDSFMKLFRKAKYLRSKEHK